jgi:hypothetical protein
VLPTFFSTNYSMLTIVTAVVPRIFTMAPTIHWIFSLVTYLSYLSHNIMNSCYFMWCPPIIPSMNMWKDGRWLSDAVNDSPIYWQCNPLASPYTCYPLYTFACIAVLGLLASSFPVVILPSLNHVRDGRFIAAHPLFLFPSSLGFPFPSILPPLSLARFLPYTPLPIYVHF